MRPAKTIFAVPTYRLRDVAETVEIYDEPFRSNGHSVKTMVFDDSSVANHQKYFSLLEQTKTVNDLYYVGPTEKEQFIGFLNRKLRDRKLESLVRNLFRPSYRGNRNFTLMYTLGAFLMSADDDMRPHALIESSPESLETEEISRGKLLKAAGGPSQEVLRSADRVSRCAGPKSQRPSCELRNRRARRGHRDGFGNQRLDGFRARKLPSARFMGSSPTFSSKTSRVSWMTS
ncbi:MAG: hypothetical protein WBV90_07070 [Terrimicrobiaceae bacterium]